MKCPDCGAEMKPLALSVYCPNDCDRIVRDEIDPEKTPKLIWFDIGPAGLPNKNNQTFIGPPDPSVLPDPIVVDVDDVDAWVDSVFDDLTVDDATD